MPKYTIGCEDGHNMELERKFDQFDSLKELIDLSKCRHVPDFSVPDRKQCSNPLYIKIPPIPYRMNIRNWAKD